MDTYIYLHISLLVLLVGLLVVLVMTAWQLNRFSDLCRTQLNILTETTKVTRATVEYWRLKLKE